MEFSFERYKGSGATTLKARGLPVGDRAFVFIAEAASNEELDSMLRSIPAWGVLTWKVTPLQSFAARAGFELVKRLKATK